MFKLRKYYALAVVALCTNAFAQAWVDKPKTALNSVVDGLQILAPIIALGVIVWKVFDIWMGKDDWKGLIPFVIGGCILAAAPTIVSMFTS